MKKYLTLSEKILYEANRIILGKENEMKLFLCSIYAGGHLLIEDLPGLGKTTLVKTFSKLLGLDIKRIQFTSDLLPADIIGTSIFEKNQFIFRPGPIFSHLVLGDELNRTSPRTQSACLQAMEEHQVTVDGVTHSLPSPFFFIATQNPRQSIGTFSLPQSQLDRFLMRIDLGFPDEKAEKSLLLGEARASLVESLEPILNPAQIIEIQSHVNKIHASETLIDYLLNLVRSSRNSEVGLSPRAGLGLLHAARSWAFLGGRDFVIPEDIQAVAPSVMNHRMDQDNNLKKGKCRAQELLEKIPIQP